MMRGLLPRILLVLLVVTIALQDVLQDVLASPVWRCPDFSILRCRNLPRGCKTYRMIYIRHGHLECPACLICADDWSFKPWPMLRHRGRHRKRFGRRGRRKKGKRRKHKRKHKSDSNRVVKKKYNRN